MQDAFRQHGQGRFGQQPGDGGWRWCASQGRPLWNNHGGLRGCTQVLQAMGHQAGVHRLADTGSAVRHQVQTLHGNPIDDQFIDSAAVGVLQTHETRVIRGR